MTREKIKRLCKMLGATRIKDTGDWVKANCPFAPYLHAKGTDYKPSFGISVSAPSAYHCFSCGAKGTLQMLPTSLEMASGKKFDAIREFIEENETFDFGNYDDPITRRQIMTMMPTSVLDAFSDVPEELLERFHISPVVAKAYNLKFDRNKNRLLFPILDEHKRLVGIRGRYVGTERHVVKYWSYTFLHPEGKDPKACGIFFGEDKIIKNDDNHKFLVIVEGERDVLLLRQGGVRNVLASMGASLSKAQQISLKILADYFDIILYFDNDKAGRLATEKCKELLKGRTNLYIVDNHFGTEDPADAVIKNKFKKVIYYALKGGQRNV